MNREDRVKVKICGLTCIDDVRYVSAAEADFAGMVVYFPKSKRNISLERAKELLHFISENVDYSLKTVAVTVSPTVSQVEDIANVGFDYIQVHGILDMAILDVKKVREGKLHIIRAYNEVDAGEIAVLRDCDEVSLYLFDAAEPGSGRGFDWNLIPDLDSLGKPYFLAGGLTPENVEHAVRYVHPYGVDVSSGVERDVQPTPEEVRNGASMKDSGKIIEFARSAGRV